MRRPWIVIALVLIGSTSFVAGRLVSPGDDDEKKKKEMEAFQAYAAPGKEHQMLARRAGKWEYLARMWMAPGAPPTETKGKSECKMVMGGRYLLDETDGGGMPEFGGGPFQGMGITGFDNFKKKYVNSWIDNMGTGIMYSEGEPSADGKEIVYTSEMPDPTDPAGKKMVKTRSVEKHLSDDRLTFAMYVPGPDGKEFKTFELEYTRKK